MYCNVHLSSVPLYAHTHTHTSDNHCHKGKTPYDPSLSPEDQLFADTLTLGGVVASHLNLKQ